jgi:hypothetical protein
MSLQTELYRLLLTADPDCGVLARVGGILSTLDLLPERLHARCHGRPPDRVIRIAGRIRVTARQADLLERKLGQLPPVIRVRCEAIGNDSAASAKRAHRN